MNNFSLHLRKRMPQKERKRSHDTIFTRGLTAETLRQILVMYFNEIKEDRIENKHTMHEKQRHNPKIQM
jgi:hypothetical protein